MRMVSVQYIYICTNNSLYEINSIKTSEAYKIASNIFGQCVLFEERLHTFYIQMKDF